MNLEYSNFYYYNKEHSICGKLSFNFTIKDLDKEINNGEEFEYTFCEEYTNKPSNLDKYIMNEYLNGKFKDFEIKEFVDTRILEEVKAQKIIEIDKNKQYLLDNDSVLYDEDLFDISDAALLRISGIIQNYTLYINNGLLEEEDVKQIWVSETDVQHTFTYKQLLELSKMMMEKVQEIVCHANVLKTTYMDSLETAEEVEKTNWDTI